MRTCTIMGSSVSRILFERRGALRAIFPDAVAVTPLTDAGAMIRNSK